MAFPAPVAIGTRGTIGSLVRKEIEYFTKFELAQKPQQHFLDMNMASCRSFSMPSRSSLWDLLPTWKRKKRRGTSGFFLPKICSVSEVADSNQLNRIPGYSYRILRNDFNNFHL
ncbi:uncharacterized protein LOC130976129 [Arachis stenosperma]|uniref:uncharacterized protein LOC130976129 n=1 Tax=Arachis stenosperma TaxID=217475 RepID=UPI0025ABD1E6|nr:uncharacterized protein LOC130976129 [Arachis stenosperma]